MVGFALATGVAIAAYTVTDGLGVRRSGSDLGYVAWLFLAGGFPIPLYAPGRARPRAGGRGAGPARGRGRSRVAGPAGLRAGAVGADRGQLAVVAALRETSVLVAALIGTLVFGERFGRRRVLAAGCITAGIVLLELAR